MTEPAAPRHRRGPELPDLLHYRASVPRHVLDRARETARSTGSPFHLVLLNEGLVCEEAIFRHHAESLGLDFIDLSAEPPDAALAGHDDAGRCLEELCVPWKRDEHGLILATAAPERRPWQSWRGESPARLAVATRSQITAVLAERFSAQMGEDAALGLARDDPDMSACTVVTRAQIGLFAAIALAAAAGVAFAPLASGIALVAAASALYLGNLIFRVVLVWIGAAPGAAAGSERHLGMRTSSLPDYTILVPMFREANVVAQLAASLRALDYPRAKLQILLILEADDDETLAAIRALALEPMFETVIVPPSLPKTKPKACNYALRFARGEFTVIYDAEDAPEHDQLRKAVARFRQCGPEVACLQARLNFYNAADNWLSRMFTLDYSLWFDFLLPGLDRLGVPLPLGGTSNHFRTAVLRALKGWDPFNVTEDADLGIRIAQKGFRVVTLDSTTFEEANTRLGNWIRQRSRWIKGYMQTWLVHMRDPAGLYRAVGLRGFAGFQLFVAGTFLTALLNPVFWSILGLSLVSGGAAFDPLFPEPLGTLSAVSLVAGNAVFVYLAMIGPFRRGWLELAPYGLSAAAYWLLISAAAYRGLWQLFTRPFYWEKTDHGFSAPPRTRSLRR